MPRVTTVAAVTPAAPPQRPVPANGSRQPGSPALQPGVPDRIAWTTGTGPAATPAIFRFRPAGPGIALRTTAAARARIERGEQQIPVVDGRRLQFPSQDLTRIESSSPLIHGQTHALTEHVGQDLVANIRRLEQQPHIHAAGGYYTVSAAQRATDLTIANPANQRAIGAFLTDSGRLRVALERVDLGADMGTTTTRSDLEAGRPALIPGRTATVVLIKDHSFPEGYRILTTYPDTRPPDVNAGGERLP